MFVSLLFIIFLNIIRSSSIECKNLNNENNELNIDKQEKQKNLKNDEVTLCVESFGDGEKENNCKSNLCDKSCSGGNRKQCSSLCEGSCEDNCDQYSQIQRDTILDLKQSGLFENPKHKSNSCDESCEINCKQCSNLCEGDCEKYENENAVNV